MPPAQSRPSPGSTPTAVPKKTPTRQYARLARLIAVSLGLLFIVLGSCLDRVRPNWFVGIRTPWTLSSRLSWTKTHRVGGWLFVASGMATHEIYKKTYFSTPSTKTHQSYRFWSGEEWNSGRGKGQQKPFDISHKNLRKGAIMPDGSWQQLVTIHDAVAKGLGKLVNVDNLRMEYSAEQFRWQEESHELR